MDYTTRLLLQKPDPDPVTGDFLDVSVLNANADKLDAVVSFTPATSTGRPATPFQGQAILETDTGKGYVWGGSAYSQILVEGAAYDARIGLGVAPSSLTARLLRTWGPGGGSVSQVLLQTSGTPVGQRALGVSGGSDSNNRWWVDFDGSMQWGDGTTGDTNLKRAAADTLRTDDNFEVGGTLKVGGVVAGTADQQEFTASGTWNKPAGAKMVHLRMVGGGGAGGGSGTAAAGAASKGSGGGGGEYVEKWFLASDLNATEAVTVGAGGTGVTGANGGAGGTSTFKGISAAGGSGGTFSASNTSNTFGISGGAGGTGGAGTADVRSGGGGGAFGISGPGLGSGGAGGSSALGGGGKGVASGGTGASTVGDDAVGYGGGGGGAQTNGAASTTAQRGGHGKAGIVIVTTYF